MIAMGKSADCRLVRHVAYLLLAGAVIGTGGWLGGRIPNLVPDLSVGIGCLALCLVLWGGAVADDRLDIGTGLKIARILAVLWLIWMIACVILGV